MSKWKLQRPGEMKVIDIDAMLAEKDAVIAQRDGELAAMREALQAANHGGDGECCWCGKLIAFDDLDGVSSHAADCARQLALSGPRAAQLAALIQAVGEWYAVRDSFTGITEIVLADAYRATLPADGGGGV